MTLPTIRALAEAAIEDDAKATKGPWLPFGPGALDPELLYEPSGWLVVSPDSSSGLGRGACQFNSDWISHARTREPALARALLLILNAPHDSQCFFTVYQGDGFCHEGQCDCWRSGLDAALKDLNP